MMEIKIKQLSENMKVPTRGTQFSAGNDLYATETAVIRPGEVHIFGTGFAADIATGYFGAIFSRSGMSTKRGLTVSTGVSVIDSDYRGEIFVGIRNQSDEDQMIYKGDRIAQMVILPFEKVGFRVVTDLPESQRDSGGFGSTGR